MRSFRTLVQKSPQYRQLSTATREATSSFYNPTPEEEDSRPIFPLFWTGQNAIDESLITLDCQKIFPNLKSISDICVVGELCDIKRDGVSRAQKIDENTNEGEKLVSMMRDVYDEHGLVVLRNTGMVSSDDMKAAVSVITKSSVLYEGGANPRDAVPESSIYETGAPLAAHIHYHHEMVYVEETVKNLGFVCLNNTDINKGHSFIANNNIATDIIYNSEFGQKLKNKGLCYIRKLPDRKFFDDNPDKTDPSMVYNYWQRSFLTEDPDEAQHIATTQKNLEVEWVDSPLFGRYMVTKHYCDAYEYDPYNDRNVVFASIADDYHWFDKWTGVMDLAHHERPLKLNFGDGEVMTRDEKKQWADAYDMSGTRLPWSRGDVVVMCNVRTAHGRPTIDLKPGEVRHIGVVLGSMMSKRGVLPDKWR
jgi:hypothetical protein